MILVAVRYRFPASTPGSDLGVGGGVAPVDIAEGVFNPRGSAAGRYSMAAERIPADVAMKSAAGG